MEGDGSYQQKENVALADTQTSTDLPTELSLGEVVTSSMIPERSRPIATGDITGLKGREILYRREMGSFAGGTFASRHWSSCQFHRELWAARSKIAK